MRERLQVQVENPGSAPDGVLVDFYVTLVDNTRRPQWQIEAMRRLEIPEDMRKKCGFPALGA